MEFKELMAVFGEQCGVGGLQIDDDGVASIQADDILLSFMEKPTTRQLVMFAEVADKPEGNLERLYEVLLEAQYLGGVLSGACFSISQGGNIALHRQDPLADLDASGLMKIVEDFLNLVDRWREVIKAYRPADEASQAEGELPDYFALGGNSGFLSV